MSATARWRFIGHTTRFVTRTWPWRDVNVDVTMMAQFRENRSVFRSSHLCEERLTTRIGPISSRAYTTNIHVRSHRNVQMSGNHTVRLCKHMVWTEVDMSPHARESGSNVSKSGMMRCECGVSAGWTQCARISWGYSVAVEVLSFKCANDIICLLQYEIYCNATLIIYQY